MQLQQQLKPAVQSLRGVGAMLVRTAAGLGRAERGGQTGHLESFAERAQIFAV